MNASKIYFIFIFSTLFSFSVMASDIALSPDAPDRLPNSINLVDSTGQDIGAPFPPTSFSAKQDQSPQAALASWFAAGNGPGTLEYQYQLYTSSIMSGSFASGYMTNITYNWSGTFNGWSDTIVYLLVVDPSGNIVGNADVTSNTSGSVSTPVNTYPADYRVAFGYIVDRSPNLRIYNGPSFGAVNVTVQYQ